MSPTDCADLRQHVDVLAEMLSRWAERDDAKAQPQVRQAANSAVESIDAALATLHRIRGRLVAEIRRSDDAAMLRSEALLARVRAERDVGVLRVSEMTDDEVRRLGGAR